MAKPDQLSEKAAERGIVARKEFSTKFPAQAAALADWNDATFLNKAKLTIQGCITNAALLLLGAPESSTLLNPAVARISWLLKNERNEELDYQHFDPPFLLAGDRILARIRNLTVRELPGGTLFPVEMTQYDPWVIREALHNCIAHQDYGLETIILLDRVQKRQPITKEEHKRLKSQELVEGRFPNPVVAAQIAAATGEKARHIRDKGFNNEYYRDLIVKIISELQPVSRVDIDKMLLDKLPEVLTKEQKLRKIHNLMMDLAHKRRQIKNDGSRTEPQWILCDGAPSAEQIKNKENPNPKTEPGEENP